MNTYDILYRQCESPAERHLLHFLCKAYAPHEIDAQRETAGYRLDFFTIDGIGWEIDGKRWHDPDRDKKRDAAILRSGVVHSIIRIPAAALHYFPDACMACFTFWTSRQFPNTAITALAARRQWQEIIQSADTEHDSRREWVEWAYDADAFEAERDHAGIGCPLAFVDGWELLSEPLKRHLASHRFILQRRSTK